MTVLLACGVLLLGCAATRPSGIQPLVTSSEGLLSWRNLPNPVVVGTSLGLYFAWVTSPLGTAPVREDLARIDPGTGRVEAKRTLSASFLSATAAHGSLFVTTQAATTSTSIETLLRLDPTTLAETGHWQIFNGPGFGGYGLIAVAGGGLWVAGGDQLARLSFTEDRITTSITLSGASTSGVTTNSGGTVLVVAESDAGGTSRIERRNPATGQLLDISAPILGTTVPFLNGVVGDDFWISEATGMMGYVELYDLDDLVPVGAPCNEGASKPDCIEGTNSIHAQLIGNDLWVTQAGGGPERNFCGTPAGQVLSALPVPDDEGVLAIGLRQHFIFVLNQELSADKGQTVEEEHVPNECP